MPNNTSRAIFATLIHPPRRNAYGEACVFVSRDARTIRNPFAIPTLRHVHPAVLRFRFRNFEPQIPPISQILRRFVSVGVRSLGAALGDMSFGRGKTEKLFLQAQSVRGKDVIPKTGKDNRLKVLIRT
jgi:hypothetical protein